jgi:hypothetical protein
MTDTKTLTKSDLAQFTGTENWYRHGMVRDVLYTDAFSIWRRQPEPTGAFAHRGNKRVAAEEFQSWKLEVNPDHSARLTCEDGNGNVVFSKIIPYSDFPLEEITLYFTNKTILLPSEY